MTACVIDTSALLAYLQGEPGEDAVGAWLDRGAAASALTVQELVSKIVRDGGAVEDAAAIAGGLGLAVHPLTEPLAIEAGAMIAVTRPIGLSQGDRACLALARSLGLPAVSADRPWSEVATGLDVTIELVR